MWISISINFSLENIISCWLYSSVCSSRCALCISTVSCVPLKADLHGLTDWLPFPKVLSCVESMRMPAGSQACFVQGLFLYQSLPSPLNGPLMQIPLQFKLQLYLWVLQNCSFPVLRGCNSHLGTVNLLPQPHYPWLVSFNPDNTFINIPFTKPSPITAF